MSLERSRSRTRRLLSPLASGFRRVFGTSRVSPSPPPPPPLFRERPSSPRSSPGLDPNRLVIPPNPPPSSSTSILPIEYLNAQQPIGFQPNPRISPSTSSQPSTYRYPGPLVDPQVNHASLALQYPEDLEFSQHDRSVVQTAPILQRVPHDQGLTFQPHGMFAQPSNFTITGGEFNDYSNSDNFMEKLLKETIPGAEFDSSDRNPPPRCHPGTRLAIIKRCQYFIVNCRDTHKLRWVVGVAGVGKSAIMQSIAEDTPSAVTLGASVFYAINGRNEGTKTITTIAYQLAVKCKPYRRFIQDEVNHDPALLTKSITAQFKRLIIQPFIHQHLLDPSHRFLILIDGLDECNSHDTQQELVRLISEFCLNYPTSPLVWIIASRPEHHITCIFDEDKVQLICEKEEILVDAEDARKDTELFLRDKLDDIKKRTISLKHLERWPVEYEFLRIAHASGGLMVYAATVVKYIGDSRYGNPHSQLQDVLKLIDATLDDQTRNPMAQLDALYLRILSTLPSGITGNTRKLLLMLAGGFDESFILECNLLAITLNDAYGATHLLPSIVDVPSPDEAHNQNLRSFHKSFVDYLSDYARSEFSRDIKREYQELVAEYTFRILEEASDGVDFDGDYDLANEGTLARGPGDGSNISLSWPPGDPDGMRHRMYTKAVSNVTRGFKNREVPFRSASSIHALTSRFETYGVYFPYFALNNFVFGDQCQEFVKCRILKQVPFNKICISNIKYYLLKLQFRSPFTTGKNLPDTWNPSCSHQREGKWEEDQDRDWTTQFSARAEESWDSCSSCCKQFEHRLENWKTHSPDHLITFLPSSTQTSWVEVRFADPEDGVSEWTYWFLLFTAPVQQHPISNCPPSRPDTSRLNVSIDTSSSSSNPILQNDTSDVRLPIGPRLPTEISSPAPSLEKSTHQFSRTDRQSVRASSPSLEYPQIRSVSQYAATNSTSQSPGMFYQGNNSTTTAVNFNDSNKSDIFMEKLRKETIPGAEFDSSSRNPPSRARAKTRLAVIGRCRYFIINHNGKKKLRLVVGPAGIGKSSVMQCIAQEALLPGARIFFSRPDGRIDGTKAITTIAYQIAAELEPYRLFVENEVTRDPSLLQKSLTIQFDRFIAKPFMHQCILDPLSRLLIIIDGLDECHDSSTQRELLRLISDFCISCPTSPVVWIIASRPEPHIASLIWELHVKRISDQDEIPVDTDEARSDIERFLRHELEQMTLTTPRQNSLHKFSDSDILKIAAVAGGLFVYASTVVRYINDPTRGDRFSQLDDILNFIESGTESSVSGLDLPLVQLDALYTFIMSKIPDGDMVNLRKLLLLDLGNMPTKSFQVQCNILGMTQVAAYRATRYIYPIADVPEPAKAADDSLRLLHKSFADYLADPSRSRFSPDIKFDAEQLIDQCVLRIVKAAPDGGYVDGMGDNANGREFGGDALKNGSGTIDDICLSWPAVEECDCRELRKTMYRESVLWVMEGFGQGRQVFQSLFCLRMLTSCFNMLPIEFPFKALRDFAFDNSRRSQLLEHGILKQMELETLRFDEVLIKGHIRRHFRSKTDKLSEHWNTSCKHEREGKWEVYNQDWSTEFECPKEDIDSPFSCSYCYQQFTHHLKRQSPGHLITVIDLTTTCRGVEFRFVDPDDGKSEWIYHFFTVERVS